MIDEYAISASVYDAIYRHLKDYAKEAELVHELIQAYKKSDGNVLLDVGCGTGLHAQYLNGRYQIEGLDFSSAMLAIARKRLPAVVFHQGDMRAFDLGRRFDAVICLFSAIAHLKTTSELNKAIACMARHLKPGGILIVEPFITPEKFQAGNTTVLVPERKVLRISTSSQRDHWCVLDMLHFTDWNAATNEAKFFQTRHELALFTVDECLHAFRSAGLNVSHEENGLMGRGIYLGVKAYDSRPSVGGDVG